MPTPDSVVVIQTYGMALAPAYDKARNVVASKWGVRYQAVAGCVVTEQLLDSVRQHNDAANALLNKKHGLGWETALEKEIEPEMAREAVATSVVRKQERRDNQRQANRPTLVAFTKLTPQHYVVSVEGWSSENTARRWVSLYKYLVDVEQKRAVLVSDSAVAADRTQGR